MKYKELTYSWEHTPQQLEQYFTIREQSYAEFLGLKHFNGEIDYFDKHSHVLLVLDGVKCVGGARLTVKSEETPKLPMEDTDFDLTNLLPEYSLKCKDYGELSRLALMPEFRRGRFSANIYRMVVEKGLDMNLDHVFALAPVLQAQRYKRVCSELIPVEIRYDVSVSKPIYEGIDLLLCIFSNPAVIHHEGGNKSFNRPSRITLS